MASPSTLAFFRNTDPVKETRRFYYELCRNMVLLSLEERLQVLEWSGREKESSDLHTGCHYFAEAMIMIYASNFPKVISCLETASEVFAGMEYKGGQMASAAIFCTCYRSMGQLDKAQNYVQQALQFLPGVPLDDIYGYFKAVTYYQAAEISIELKNYDAALEYYKEGLPFAIENKELKGRLLNGMGVLFMNQEKWKESIAHLEESFEVIHGQHNFVLESKILADIGMYYFRMKDFQRSLENQEKSLGMRLENGMINPAITNYIRLTELCMASGDPEKAKAYGLLAVEEAEKLKVNMKLYEAHQALAAVYEKMGDLPNAYAHFKKFHQHREEVHSQDVMRKVEQMKNQHKVESAQQEKEIFRLRNVELKAALDEIKESFRYAQRIQSAILPPQKLVDEVLKDSFILFRPKDIVSGDFYWLEQIEDQLLLAAVDCTGHGVPGAMVSMVGNNCLNRAVHEFGLTKPAEILDQLTVLVEGTFMHKDLQYSEEEIKDGMDISLCRLGLKARKISWAGANNPLWLLRDGKITEVTADKQPIGKFDNRQPFTEHEFSLEKGDCIYLFTDGYADQFGGPKGKKFSYRQLKELLVRISTLPMEEQLDTLARTLHDWRGNLEQVDDVTIAGIRI